jgi:hypothetical protein
MGLAKSFDNAARSVQGCLDTENSRNGLLKDSVSGKRISKRALNTGHQSMNTTATQNRSLVLAATITALLLNAGPAVGPDATPGLSSAPSQSSRRHACAGKMGVPVGLSVSAPEEAITAGAQVALTVEVSAEIDLSSIRIALRTEGPVQLEGPATIDLAFLPGGQTRRVEIPVRYTADGHAAVHVQLAAEAAGGLERFGRRQTFYARLNNGRAYGGHNGFRSLQVRETQEDFAAGEMTDDEFADAVRRLLTLDGVSHTTVLAPPPGEEGLAPSPPTITVRGSVTWEDENGAAHPVYGMAVQVWDDEAGADQMLAQLATGVDGQYSFTLNNNDGAGEGGLDIFVRVRTANGSVSIEQPGMGPYQQDSGTTANVPDGGTVQMNFVFRNNTANGPAASVLTAASYAAAYATVLNGGTSLAQLPIEWPGTRSTSLFDGSRIHLLMLDRWDWDVIFHEYGHYVMDRFAIDNNPGGNHSSSTCLSDTRMSKDIGIRLAWGEGWPTYFGTAGQARFGLASLNVPRVGDVNYDDTEDITVNYSLETQTDGRRGEDNETAVQRMLWDLFDAASDSRDNISVSDQTLFDRINAADPDNLSQAWAALRNGLSAADDLAYGGVAADHGVGPQLTGPANNSIARPNTVFSWNAGVGCNGMTFGGNSFDLVFFHPTTLGRILTVPNLTTTSHQLTLAQYQSLVGATRQVRFAVEGRNTANPATGPYLGDNFLATLNRPPVANAGNDQLNVECTSPAGAVVMLNGAASSDPDGDMLAYSWSAPGITFNNPASATPTATFPGGAPVVVTLTVSDGIETDTDTVSIRVVDTTPPVVNCPADITVECTQHGGTPATHPAIAAFLAGASAVDICDPTPTLANNAPAFFNHGITVVTWTARDDDGNTSTCSARVNVVDTTPPVITVQVTPDTLWAPNHRLVTVRPTVIVTDICDPNPTFVLTSITVNEPDNGLGDGNTTGDVRQAAYGTPDTTFQLRSERSGPGNGRVYTIRYTARDMAGNTASATARVTVTHDRR